MNSTEALREFARLYCSALYYKDHCASGSATLVTNEDQIIVDLTALISEHYVERAKYDELLRQRDELRELYDWLKEETADGLSTFEMPHDFADILRSKLAAIKNTER